LAVAEKDATLDGGQPNVGCAGRMEECGRRVVARYRVGTGQGDRAEVGILARFEGAGAIVDAEDARALDGGEAEEFVGREQAAGPESGALEELGEACFFEDVEAVVARDR